jgi:hypothetical protein
MGASLVYLEKPNKEVILEEGESQKLKYAAGQMQGWRINMVPISLIPILIIWSKFTLALSFLITLLNEYIGRRTHCRLEIHGPVADVCGL